MIILTGLFLAGWPAFAQGPDPLKVSVQPQTLIADLEKAIPGLMKEADIPGLSIAVIRDGYRLLNSKKYPEAIAVLKLNVEAYPESANVYDSLAEAYLKSDNKEQAVAHYKKVLEMIPKDKKADRAFLEGLKSNGLEKLKELEKK